MYAHTLTLSQDAESGAQHDKDSPDSVGPLRNTVTEETKGDATTMPFQAFYAVFLAELMEINSQSTEVGVVYVCNVIKCSMCGVPCRTQKKSRHKARMWVWCSVVQ
jgi:hypothetical protein